MPACGLTRPTSRPGTGGTSAAARQRSTASAIAAADPGYHVPATAAGRTALAIGITSAIGAVVDLREDVVPLLELPEDRLVEPAFGERPVEVREPRDVVARALLRVLDGGPRLHDEGPVGRL